MNETIKQIRFMPDDEIYDIQTDATRTATSETGSNIVEFTDGADAPLVKCVTQITGSQDLHGYDKPWVGGAGKNMLPNLSVFRSTDSYYIGQDDLISYPIAVENGHTYRIIFKGEGAFSSFAYYRKYGGSNTQIGATGSTFTATEDANIQIWVYGVGLTGVTDFMLSEGSTEYPYEPYSNVCPITAYTEGEIEVSDGDGNTTTHTTTYPSAIYRGSEDCVNGTAITEWGMIASYAGETLPGEWISDRDEYAPGTTPTTGAQVAYALATPTTSSVTPTNLPIKSLSGYNHIESSTGDMEVEYIAKGYQPLVDLMSDENVTQTETSTDANYEVLFSGTADNTTRTEGTGKSSGFIYNPNKKSLLVGILKNNTTLGLYATASGHTVEASGNYSHAGGALSTASGTGSHAEGNSTTASGQYSHAEGVSSTASEQGAHAEGYNTTASGANSHTEGSSTTASGSLSHSEGYSSTASGYCSHAEGAQTTANHAYQHVFGYRNIPDPSSAIPGNRGNYIEIVGNGDANTNTPSNARTLDWSGNEWIAGTLTQGSSRKIKKNISNLDPNEINKILQLNAVQFDYKQDESNDAKQRGFIAEDVAEILPCLVTNECVNSDGEMVSPASLNYIAIIPYLVEICKKQQKEIDRLKEEIARMK